MLPLICADQALSCRRFGRSGIGAGYGDGMKCCFRIVHSIHLCIFFEIEIRHSSIGPSSFKNTSQQLKPPAVDSLPPTTAVNSCYGRPHGSISKTRFLRVGSACPKAEQEITYPYPLSQGRGHLKGRPSPRPIKSYPAGVHRSKQHALRSNQYKTFTKIGSARAHGTW